MEFQPMYVEFGDRKFVVHFQRLSDIDGLVGGVIQERHMLLGIEEHVGIKLVRGDDHIEAAYQALLVIADLVEQRQYSLL